MNLGSFFAELLRRNGVRAAVFHVEYRISEL